MLAAVEGFRKRIPKTKAECFWDYIATQNALLHLEFQQENFTSAVLLATCDSPTFYNLLLPIKVICGTILPSGQYCPVCTKEVLYYVDIYCQFI
uniref:Bm13403 n=1 Tax=Brugia malayi TaxID=6279 RepID=A0A0J9XQN1_BRUMA|nr:Bm13403 [Brugia malayi]